MVGDIKSLNEFIGKMEQMKEKVGKLIEKNNTSLAESINIMEKGIDI